MRYDIIVCAECGHKQKVTAKGVETDIKDYDGLIHCLKCSSTEWVLEEAKVDVIEG